MMKKNIIYSIIFFLIFINGDLLGENRREIKLPSENINKLIQDRKGFIWIGTDLGLLRYDGVELEVFTENVFNKKSLSFDQIKFIKEIEGKLVLGNNIGDFSIFNLEKKTFKNYKMPNEEEIIEVIKKNDDSIYILTSTLLFQFNIESKSFYEIYRGEEIINFFCEANNIYIVQRDKIVKLIDENIKETLFKGKIDLSLFVFGNIYISQNNNLYKLGTDSLFEILETKERIEKIIYISEGKYGIITNEKMIIYNLQKEEKIKEFNNDSLKEVLLFNKEDEVWFKNKNSLELVNLSNRFYSIVKNNRDNEGIFTYNEIEYLYNDKRLYKYLEGEEVLVEKGKIDNINYFEGNIYFTINKFLYKNFKKKLHFDIEPDNLLLDENLKIFSSGKKIYVEGKIEKVFEIDTEVNKISFDLWNKDIIWIGTKAKGLVKLNIVLNQIEFIRNVFLEKNYYKIDEVEDFVLLEDKILVYSPEGNLLVYDYEKEFTKASIEINQFKNTKFLEDKMGNIWFGTSNDIYRFNNQLDSIYSFTKELNKDLDTITNSFVDLDGNVYFTFNGGFVVFYPNEIAQIEEDKAITFRKVFFAEEERIEDISYLRKLYVPYYNKSFIISFSLLDYFKSKDRNYVYRLNGYRWIKLDKTNEINFALLPSGKYILEVSYFDINNKLSDAYDEIEIYIEASPWQSVGAYLLYITLLFILLEFIRRYKLKGKKLVLHKELQKLSNIFFNIENSKEMTIEFMEKLCLFIGIIDAKFYIKEDKQEYITCYKYNLYINFLEEEVIKDENKKSLKVNEEGIYYELERDIINNLTMSRRKNDNKVEFLFDLDEKYSGIFEFEDTESRHKKDRFLYKTEMLLRQFIINYKNIISFEEISKFANFDSLTGVYNRRYFDQMALLSIEQSRRYKHSMTVAIFDIDSFKCINDSYGHHTGDEVLKGIAERVKESIRETDIFARYGGEEFIICFTETDRERAMHVCERIRREIEKEEFLIDKRKIRATITIGLAELHLDDTLDSLLKRADKALYRGKNTGKNKGVIHINGSEKFVDVSTLINGQLV